MTHQTSGNQLRFINTTETNRRISHDDRRLINRHCQGPAFVVSAHSDGTQQPRDPLDSKTQARGTSRFRVGGLRKRKLRANHTAVTTKNPHHGYILRPFDDTVGRSFNPFDTLPISVDHVVSSCIQYYASGYNLGIWSPSSQSPGNFNVALDHRRDFWLPLISSSPAVCSALIAFLQSLPGVPSQFKNSKVELNHAVLALRHLSDDLTNTKDGEVSDAVLTATTLLMLRSSGMRDIESYKAHAFGLYNMVRGRQSIGAPKKTFVAPMTFESIKAELQKPSDLGFKMLREAGLTPRDLSNPIRNVHGKAARTLLMEQDPISTLLCFEFATAQWVSVEQPLIDGTPHLFERACINTITLTGCAFVQRCPKLARSQCLINTNICISLVHNDLFEGLAESGLKEIGEICPGALAWIGLAAGHFNTTADQGVRKDFAYLLQRALLVMKMHAYEEILMYMHNHFAWSEVMDERAEGFFRQSSRLYPLKDKVDKNTPWLRPR